MYKYRIWVRQKKDVLDPETKTIQQKLAQMGYQDLNELAQAKVYELVFNKPADELVEKLAQEFFINPVSQVSKVEKIES